MFDVDLRARFAADYSAARAKFLAAVGLLGGDVRSYDNPLRGPQGEALATDVAWIGPRAARKLLVTVSATHGVEGFCGSGAQIDWLLGQGLRGVPSDTALLFVHAINPHGFAWLRRVTEEGCDLNRNFIDFAEGAPANPGYAELADALVPPEITGPGLAAAEAQIAAWRAEHGERAFQIARGGGQYTHPHGVFYGGSEPTWARRTLEAIIAADCAGRDLVAIVDFHTGLGPFGYGEPIAGNPPDSAGFARARDWYGDSLTAPTLGTSSSVPKNGMAEAAWCRALGDRAIYVALEYGTYPPDRGRVALRDDHWLHQYTNVDWSAPETKRIKAAIRKQYFPDTPDWHEQVLFRSRQILRQALAGLARG
jgi:hypothetical protein